MSASVVDRMIRRARRFGVRILRAWETGVRARARRQRVWDDTVLYESFAGNGALDNPEAIFRALLAAPDQSRLRHIWVLTPGHREFREEFRRDPRVRVVRYRSRAYLRAISRARVLINNATFPPEWGKRPGQLYLNTWHGTPIKHMGYDMPDGALQSANVLRNLLQADVLLSQSSWMTRRMYLDAYRLRGVYPGRILEVGYPRTDRQELAPQQREAVRDALRAARTPRRAVVVYAPTWTGERFGAPRDEADAMLATVAGLQQRLGNGYRVVLKAHQSVHRLLAARPGVRDVLISNDLPTNVLLGVTDHLITDFSSIFFDYLARDLPISFYVPDPGAYREERGAYFDDDELPGAVVHDLDALAARILAEDDPVLERRRAWAERFAPRTDGHAADRVIDAVFRDHPVRSIDATDGRLAILLYLGGMRANGITSSALNLLGALDHDRFDVSVLIARPVGSERRRSQALLDPRVRQFVRQGGMNAGKVAMGRLKLRERLRPGTGEAANERRLYSDEWRRLFGDARFDAVVDFSGYSRFWGQLLLHSPAARRTIWLHNDMAAEVHRSIGGRKRMRLPGVFALYPRFDALVSVSPELSKLNRASLAGLARLPASSFISARNLVDAVRVRDGSRVPIADLPELQEGGRPAWVAELDDPRLVWFVAVGRLSPEKNHLRLLDAFAAVRADHPESRLLLVGDGPMREELDAGIARAGLEGAAHLTGAMENPFPLMAAADCFVLSSDHEGQPMVLLEAAALGMPIISTGFGSIADALPDGAVAIVASEAAALADGMRAFLQGAVRPTAFDVDDYNRAALREAETAILGDAARDSSSTSSSSTIASVSASTATRSQAATASTAAAPPAMPMTHHMTTSDPRSAATHARGWRPRTL